MSHFSWRTSSVRPVRLSASISDARSLEVARGRTEGTSHISFVEGDLVDLEFEDAFDACVGRFILQHLSNPVATIRMAARSVRPGGILAFQDIDLSRPVPAVWPESPLALRCAEVFRSGRPPGGN